MKSRLMDVIQAISKDEEDEDFSSQSVMDINMVLQAIKADAEERGWISYSRFIIEIEEVLKVLNDGRPNSHGKKDNSDSSNENYLESQNRIGEDKQSEHMPISADNPRDTSRGII